MKLSLVTLSVIALAVLGGGYATNQARAENVSIKCPNVQAGVWFYRNSTWHLQDKLQVSHTRVAFKVFHSCKFARWTANLWRHRSRVYYAKYQAHLKALRAAASALPPHNALWECIHSGEADWYNQGGGAGNSYYGGLQMHYAWGYGVNTYAYLLSALQQKWAAERGYAASRYSRTWLWGQWAADEARCWMLA